MFAPSSLDHTAARGAPIENSQLAFAFADHQGVARLGDHFPVELRWSMDDVGVECSVTDVRGERRFSLGLRVVPPVAMVKPGPYRTGNAATGVGLSWSLARGLPLPRRRSTDVFRILLEWAHETMFPAADPFAPPGEDPGRGRRPPDEVEVARATMRFLYARLRKLAVHAVDRCLPRPRGIALRFAEHLRFRVYERVTNDDTGRLAQLATACPGAFIFALALVERGGASADAGEAILAEAIAGRRLKGIVDRAVVVWADEAASIVAEEAQRAGREIPVWRRVAAATGAERDRLLAAQRLLVLRAGPRVNTTYLWLPPPIAFAPEDIPRAVRANARWYRVARTTGAMLRDDDTGTRRALAAFASRHADVLYLRGGRARNLRRTLNGLLDYLVAVRRRPARSVADIAVEASRGADQ